MTTLKFAYKQKTRVRFDDINNMLSSAHGKGILFFLKQNDFTIFDVPEDITLDFPKVGHIPKDNTEQTSESSFDRGHLSESEHDLVKSKQIDHLTISKMLGGWYHSLPYPHFYRMYPKETVVEDIRVILFNSIVAAKTKFGDNGLVDLMVGNVPLLLSVIDYDAEWGVIYSSFCKFMELSHITMD